MYFKVSFVFMLWSFVCFTQYFQRYFDFVIISVAPHIHNALIIRRLTMQEFFNVISSPFSCRITNKIASNFDLYYWTSKDDQLMNKKKVQLFYIEIFFLF